MADDMDVGTDTRHREIAERRQGRAVWYGSLGTGALLVFIDGFAIFV